MSRKKRGSDKPILLSNLIKETDPNRPKNNGHIKPFVFKSSHTQTKKVVSPISGHSLLKKFVSLSNEILPDLSMKGLVSSTEMKSFQRNLDLVWKYWDELNRRWSVLQETDTMRFSVLKKSRRWGKGLEDHLEFLDDTHDLIDVLTNSGEMSIEDRQTVQRKINEFQSIVLGLRKKVHDVKGY